MHAPKKGVCVKTFQVSNERIKSAKVWYQAIYKVGKMFVEDITYPRYLVAKKKNRNEKVLTRTRMGFFT